MELHEIVKKHRKQKGLTQAQLAEKLNVAERTVSRAETGATKSRPLLLTAARVLEIPEEELRAAGRTGGVLVTDPDGRMFLESPDGERAELEDEEFEAPESSSRGRSHWLQNGLEVARFISTFYPRVRVCDPAESAERFDAIKQFVKCAEDFRDRCAELSDLARFEAEQALHGAWLAVTSPVDSSERKLLWVISGTTKVTQRDGESGGKFESVEATLVVELVDYTDMPLFRRPT